MNPYSPLCKPLLLGAWAIAVIGFGVALAASGGFGLAAFAWWSLLGLPLAVFSLWWLRVVRAAPSPWLVTIFGILWLTLIGSLVALAVLGDAEPTWEVLFTVLGYASIAMPLVLLLTVLISSAKAQSSPGPSA